MQRDARTVDIGDVARLRGARPQQRRSGRHRGLVRQANDAVLSGVPQRRARRGDLARVRAERLGALGSVEDRPQVHEPGEGEHAVLLAALGRINGLPSRVVAGLAYVPLFGNEDDIFGYHMWTQFYIDGRWIDVDAALRETECSPARIAFAISSLQNAGLADLSLPLLSKIGAISLEIREME